MVYRRIAIFMAVCFFGLFIFVTVSLAETINDYKCNNDDEAAIVGVLKEYQRIINSYKWIDYLPLFTNDAMVQTEPGGKIITIKEYKDNVLDQNQAKFEKYGCEYIFHVPEKLTIQGDEAKVVIGRAFSTRKGNTNLSNLTVNFIKVNDTWKMKEVLHN